MTAIYDVLLGQDGDLPIAPRHVTGVRRVLQKVANRWRIHRGEWKKDTEFGQPYEDWIFENLQNVEEIGATLLEAAESIDEVIRIDNYNVTKAGEAILVTGTIVVEGEERVEFETTIGGPEFGNFLPVVYFHFGAGTIAYG